MNITAVVAQFPVSQSIQTNLEFIDSVLEQTNAGDLILFPEGSASGYSTDLSFLERINQQELAAGLLHLQKETAERRINAWVGACTIEKGLWFNTAYGFCADRKTRVYHKTNLANHERGIFSAGDHLPVFELNTPEGKVIVGIQICRELRFPEQWGWLARCGAQIILHLNNAIGEDSFQPVWRSHLVSRAAETQRFVLSANNAAPKQISPTIVVAPDGQVIAEVISDKPETLRVQLDLTKVSNWYLDQSRADVFVTQSNQD
jgi:predicted amidohydrolase